MKRSWVEVVGGVSLVRQLAHDCGVDTSPGVLDLLERFGTLLDDASQRHTRGARKMARVLHEVDIANSIAEDEVKQVKQDLSDSEMSLVDTISVERHVETCLPVVSCRLRGLPELVIHLKRNYAVHKCGVSYGFRKRQFSAWQRTGPVAAATNKLDSFCRSKDWQVSLVVVLRTWITAALEIPKTEVVVASGTARQRDRRVLKQGSTDTLPVQAGRITKKEGGSAGSVTKSSKAFEEIVACGGPRRKGT